MPLEEKKGEDPLALRREIEAIILHGVLKEREQYTLQTEIIKSENTAEELKTGLEDIIHFLLDNIGTVKDYRDCSIPNMNEYDQKVDELLRINRLLTNDANEDLIKGLFTLCTSSEDYTSKEYLIFYIKIDDFTIIPYYGDILKTSIQTNSLGDYSVVRGKLNGALNLLKGITYTDDRYIIYSKLLEDIRNKNITKSIESSNKPPLNTI